MKRLIGYILSILGILSIVLGFGNLGTISSFFSFLDKKYFTIAGIVFVLIGIVILKASQSASSKKPKQASEEVPIYEGEGKHRKIVGYRRG